MNKEQTNRSLSLLNSLISKSESIRAFARLVREDVSDISRWKNGHKTLTTRAIVSICRLYGCRPHDLNADLFPSDLKFIFEKGKDHVE